MRRMPTLAAALIIALLLTACASPQPASTPQPTSTPEPTAAPTPEPTPGTTIASVLATPTPDILPDAGFEPESYWLAEPYGDEGEALMMSRQLPSGGVHVKCWYSACTVFGSGEAYSERYLQTSVFTAMTGADGAFYLFDYPEGGRLSIEGDTLTVSYPDDGTFDMYPTRFYRVSEEQAREAWRSMPYNAEVRLPLPFVTTRKWILAIPGIEDMGEGSYRVGGLSFLYRNDYYFEYVSVTEPGTGFSVRGIDVGSTLEEICENFSFEVSSPTDMKHFYGSDGFMGSRAELTVDYSGRNLVSLLDDASSQTYIYLDDAGTVEEIVYCVFL